MSKAWLLLETSERTRLGIARDGECLAEVDLGSGRQQNRQLLPAIQQLLVSHLSSNERPEGIAVSTGPGSYTGLRVGMTAAKTLAYAWGCSLVAVPTFEIVAKSCGPLPSLHVIGDALNSTLYHQAFRTGVASQPVTLVNVHEWMVTLTKTDVVTGPGLKLTAKLLSDRKIETCVSQAGLDAFALLLSERSPLTLAEYMALEPLYLRGSSAEEKVKQQVGA